MAASDILKSAGSSITGAMEKAILEITDERNLSKADQIKTTKTEPRAAGGMGISSVSSKVNEAAAKAAGLVKGKGAAMAIEAMSKGLSSKSEKKKRYEVKFNPSQITFQAYDGKQLKKDNAAAGKKNDAKYHPMKPIIQMNIPLVFDDCERTEAFMTEKFSDPAAMTRTAVSAAASSITGKSKSVQPQVEGFLGALKNTYTRKITFYWGAMCYQGLLTKVDAEYTMFSTDGSPIRARVNIGIQLIDSQIADDHMGQWQTSFNSVFEESDRTNAGSVTQRIGNLVNINL